MVAFYNPADQELYKQFQYLPQEQYRLGLNLPTNTQAEAVNTAFGIPATNAFTSGGGGGGGYYTGSPNNLIQDYTTATKNQYFDSQKTPLVDMNYNEKLQSEFMGFPSYRQQELTGPDMGEYIGGQEIGYTPRRNESGGELGFSYGTEVPLELTTAGKIQSNLAKARDFGSGIMSNIRGFGPISFIASGIDRFSSLPTANQEFIKMNMGYTGPTVFGENKSGLSKDPFGINTRSLLGDYGAFVDKQVEGYEDITDEELAQLSNLQRQKINFYRQKQEEFKQVQKQILDQQMRDDKFYGGQGQSDPGDTSRSGASGRRPGSGGTVDRVTEGPGRNVDDTGQAYDSGGREGFGYGLKKGGLVSIL